MCVYYIYGIWKKLFFRFKYNNLLWEIVYKYNVGEYKENMGMIEVYDIVVYVVLLRIESEKWCKVFFCIDFRCYNVRNNFFKKFNMIIRIARLKYVFFWLEDIRR